MANGPRRPSLVRQTTEPPVDYGNLTDEQIINMLSSSETREYGGMPLGPGSVLNVLRLGKNLPNILRRFRGLFKANPQSTAPSNTLRDVVLSDKPANVSRRAFLTNPIQAAVDIPQTLREIGLPEESIKTGKDITVDQWGYRDENEKVRRDQDILEEYIANRHSDVQPEDFASEADMESGNPIDEWEAGYDEYLDFKHNLYERLQDIINKKLVRTGYRSGSKPGSSGISRDIGTMARIYRDEVLKESAEKAGRSLEEELEVQRKELSKPGVVSKAVESVRRRYGR